MVLTNALLIGLVLVSICTPVCISEVQREQSPSQETTITSVEKIKIESQNVTSTTQIIPTTTSKPKTDVTSNKPIEQKGNRGSTKYSDTYSTVKPSNEVTTTKRKSVDDKSTRQTTVRNDRSLTINTDRYNSPEFHSENNIYSETQNADKKYAGLNKEKLTTSKPWEHANYADFSLDLTTPKNEVFDNVHKRLQEDITKSLEGALTTSKNYMIDDKYKQVEDYDLKSIELTTPKNDAIHEQFEKIRQDITKSLETNVDTFFDENKRHDDAENVEKPQLNEPKIDYTRFRRIEAIESKNKNKVRKDYNKESGLQMKLTSDYNNSQTIDAPGVVVNTIPGKKDAEADKKADLEQGETRLEKISIEKPEKDPGLFISNKIENEFVNVLSTEGPEERPFENKNIYLSKRGSTIQNAEQAIQKSLPTESVLPIDLYPSRVSPSDLDGFSFNNVQNTTTSSKSVKKDKASTRIMKKELEISQSDLDNKIPKFIPLTTPQYDHVETTSANPLSVSPKELVTTTVAIAADINSTTEQTEAATSVKESHSTTSLYIEADNAVTTEKLSMSTTSSDREFTTEFFEIADGISTSSASIDETTTYVEFSTEDKPKITEITTEEPVESIGTTQINVTTEDFEEVVHTTTSEESAVKQETTTVNIPTVSKTLSNVGLESTVHSLYNQSKNGAMDIYEYTNDSPDTTVNIDNINILNHTNEHVGATTIPYNFSNSTEDDVYDTRTMDNGSVVTKKNETVPSVLNEITKPPNFTTVTAYDNPTTKRLNIPQETATVNIIHSDEASHKENITKKLTENEQSKQNEIILNGDKVANDDCENIEDSDGDYIENNCKNHNTDEGNDAEAELDDNNNNGHAQNNFNGENKKSVNVSVATTSTASTDKLATTAVEEVISTITINTTDTHITATTTTSSTVGAAVTTFATPLLPNVRAGDTTEPDVDSTTKSESIISSEEDEEDGGNGGRIAAIVISTIGGVCLLLLVALLIIMKKRQKRFNYGQRCRPVSLDAYSMDNVSIHNSTRRKGVLMTSKRSYGNPAFEDPTSPSNQLNFSELLKFANNEEAIKSEFDKIPQVTTKTNELPEGCDIKNRYANVIPLPETRVFLNPIEGVPSSDYINANYVTGPQGARHYYIACQAPMQNTIEDFWRMIWEQQSKVVLMLTHLYENGVEKCIDYLPPSEVLDCHRLFGDYQITLKKREVKDKYIISNLQIKNMISNSWREITHLWYMGWPEKGVPEEANSLIAFLIEARSCIKMGENKVKETNNTNISNGLALNINPVIVHCSPGTGRTGTVIACDIAVREFELSRKVNIPRIVYRVRRDRASAVQTKEQYDFIYKVINFYATKLTGGVFDSF